MVSRYAPLHIRMAQHRSTLSIRGYESSPRGGARTALLDAQSRSLMGPGVEPQSETWRRGRYKFPHVLIIKWTAWAPIFS